MLFSSWRNMCHSSLIYVMHAFYGLIFFILCTALLPECSQCAFLQSCIVKPCIIIASIVSNFILVLYTSLAQYGVLENRLGAMLFFKLGIGSTKIA